MGWTPRRTTDSSARGSGAANPSPAPRRRRARTEQAAPIRPESGRPGKQGDERIPITIQIGKRWGEIITAVKMGEYTWTEFVENLDEEELARGQLKDKNGRFQGRPPQLIPREFLLACQREMKRRFDELFQSDVIPIAKEYLKMAQSKDLKPETKAKMLQYAMERVFGAIPKDVRLQTEAPWEQMIVNVMGGEDDKEMPEHLARRYAGYRERQGGTEEE